LPPTLGGLGCSTIKSKRPRIPTEVTALSDADDLGFSHRRAHSRRQHAFSTRHETKR
jgi:hypothetical protein